MLLFLGKTFPTHEMNGELWISLGLLCKTLGMDTPSTHCDLQTSFLRESVHGEPSDSALIRVNALDPFVTRFVGTKKVKRSMELEIMLHKAQLFNKAPTIYNGDFGSNGVSEKMSSVMLDDGLNLYLDPKIISSTKSFIPGVRAH